MALGLVPIAGCKGTVVLDCSNEKPAENGLVSCGTVELREGPATCSAHDDANDQCSFSATCKPGSPTCQGAAHPFCDSQCECRAGCTTDADCGAGKLCYCGPEGGECAVAACKTSADCVKGQSCIFYEQPVCFGSNEPNFGCTTDHDECLPGQGCDPQKEVCTFNGQHFACAPNYCNVGGRPFYVQGQLRTAPLARGAQWPSALAPALEGLPEQARAALARRWSHIGQLEHASIASFARFALQLLSLGAPPELLEQTTSAMADETLHARLAFGLASAYTGARVGPGNLEVGGALGDGDVTGILRTLVEEGCVGETFAAAVAREERARTADPVVAAVLDRIAEDEERHAVLAFRALGWLVSSSREARTLAAALRREIGILEAEVAAAKAAKATSAAPRESAHEPPGAGDLDLSKYGVVSEAEMAELRTSVLETVVLPAARALLQRSAQVGAEGYSPAIWTPSKTSEGVRMEE